LRADADFAIFFRVRIPDLGVFFVRIADLQEFLVRIADMMAPADCGFKGIFGADCGFEKPRRAPRALPLDHVRGAYIAPPNPPAELRTSFARSIGH